VEALQTPGRFELLDIKRARRDRWIRGVCGGVAVIIPGPSTLLAFVVYLLLGFVLPETEEY
jgi:phage shock protein PspC (stress-responsive transcriptional regulator)